jgi:glycosyltransferase involved in cell wall biosynthesis
VIVANDNMRIVFGYYGSQDDISGVTTWLVPLMTRFLEEKWEVHCLVEHFGKNPKQSQIFQSATRLGVKVHLLPRGGYMERMVRETVRHLRRLEPTVFLPQILVGHHHSATQARAAGLPFIYTMHSDDALYWGILDELAQRGFSGPVICVSSHLQERVRAQFPDVDCRMIAYGVPCDNMRAQYSTKPFRVVFCGRVVEEQKRISAVVKSMIRICRKFESVECCIIGDGSERAAVEAQIAAAGMTKRILLLGRLSNEAARKQLSQCQALLLLSEYEGLPLAVLEAMSVGVIPICRRIPSGIPELVINGVTGFLVDDEDAEVETIIGRLLSEAGLWESVSQAARQLVEARYSREKCNQAWVDLVLEVSKTRSASLKWDSNIQRVLPPINPKLMNYDFRTPPIHKRIYRRLRRIFVKAKSK